MSKHLKSSGRTTEKQEMGQSFIPKVKSHAGYHSPATVCHACHVLAIRFPNSRHLVLSAVRPNPASMHLQVCQEPGHAAGTWLDKWKPRQWSFWKRQVVGSSVLLIGCGGLH